MLLLLIRPPIYVSVTDFEAIIDIQHLVLVKPTDCSKIIAQSQKNGVLCANEISPFLLKISKNCQPATPKRIRY